MQQSSMIQPLLQCGPMAPAWKAVGGAHCVAAWQMVSPRTVRYPTPVCRGKKQNGRTLISTQAPAGSPPPKSA